MTAAASTSGLHVSLHPLVLLTVSDYITRHTLRNSQTPLIGALLGQQKGQEITIEHAYDVKVNVAQDSISLEEAFFADRLQQYRDVHKAPALDLVGWWTIGSAGNGPVPELLSIHKHILHNYNENGLFLVFHPEAAGKQALEQQSQKQNTGNKLPLTIFETVWETAKGDRDGDAIMQDDGQGKTEADLIPKIFELPYEVSTGEAEMIAMDFVAKGSGNATAVETRTAAVPGGENSSSKGKSRAKEQDEVKKDASSLNAQEEELIAFLSTRANAVKMLQQRIAQLKSYLKTLPPTYLTSSTIPISDTASDHSTVHPVLRSVLALTSRLPHLLPADIDSFLQEQSAEQADVAIVSLLGALGRSTIDAKELGRTFSIADSAKSTARKSGRPGRPDMDGYMDRYDVIGGFGGDADRAGDAGMEEHLRTRAD